MSRDRTDELRKLSRDALAQRFGRRLGMGGAWGLEKLPKDTLVAMLDAIELPTFAAEEDSDEEVAAQFFTSAEGQPLRQRLIEELMRVRSAEREACAQVATKWAANYPEDVFPGDSTSIDAKCGTFGRHCANKIAEDIRARGEA